MEDEVPGDPSGDDLKSPAGDKRPAWAVPARRSDAVGDLAYRLCGDLDKPPDFTAAPPLVEAVREREGDAAADALANQFVLLLGTLPRGTIAELDVTTPSPEHIRIVGRLRGRLRNICAAYLYDLTSACGVLAHIVELATRPLAKAQTGQAQVDVVFCPVSQWATVGNRVTLPDGRRGIVVVARRPDGLAGVMPDEDGPQTTNDGAVSEDGGEGELP